MHAAEGRMARAADGRFREAVEAVRIGYLIARDKKALRDWQRRRPKGQRGKVGLTGRALEQAMSGILLAHPEFLKGVPRPPHLQPRAMRKPAGKRSRKAQG